MDKKKDWNLELSEYIKQGEPNRVEKTKTWETAIGLQDVDGLKPSKYLIKTAKEHIEGNIDIHEVKDRINQYYEALDKAHTTSDYTDFVKLVTKLEVDMLKKYLELL